jgi:hypothetical protein
MAQLLGYKRAVTCGVGVGMRLAPGAWRLPSFDTFALACTCFPYLPNPCTQRALLRKTDCVHSKERLEGLKAPESSAVVELALGVRAPMRNQRAL